MHAEKLKDMDTTHIRTRKRTGTITHRAIWLPVVMVTACLCVWSETCLTWGTCNSACSWRSCDSWQHEASWIISSPVGTEITVVQKHHLQLTAAVLNRIDVHNNSPPPGSSWGGTFIRMEWNAEKLNFGGRLSGYLHIMQLNGLSSSSVTFHCASVNHMTHRDTSANRNGLRQSGSLRSNWK